MKNLITNKKKTIVFLALSSIVTLGYSQPNFTNVQPGNVTNTVDTGMLEAFKWASWALWALVLLMFIATVYQYQTDSPSKKTSLIGLGVVVLLAGIATAIFGL